MKPGVGRIAAIASASIAVAVFAFSAYQQSLLLQRLDVLHQPKLIRSHTKQHAQYMQMSAFKANPIPVAGPDLGTYYCRRPFYRLRWNALVIDTNANEKFDMAARPRDGYCAGMDGDIAGPHWTDYGQTFRIEAEQRLSRSNARNMSQPMLAYSDSTPILLSYKIKFSTSRSTSGLTKGTDWSLPYSVALDAASDNHCILNYESGALNGCRDSAPSNTINFAVPYAHTHTRSDTIANISAVEKEQEFVIFEALNDDWESVAGKIKSGAKIPIPCNDAETDRIASEIGISNIEIDFRISCTRELRQATTEAQWLAHFAYSQGKPIAARNSRIDTTLDRNLDNALNQPVSATDGACAESPHIGICDGMETVVMNTLSGEILGIASRRPPHDRSENRQRLPVTNFEMKSPGSVAKVVFTSAALESTVDNSGMSPLRRLVLHRASPDGIRDKETWSCRIGTQVIPNCVESGKLKGAYVSRADGGDYDLTRFLVKSENQYMATLLYLASSSAVPRNSHCNKAFYFFGGHPYRPGWALSFSGTEKPSLPQWLAGRAPVFKDGSGFYCESDGKLAWLEHMRKEMHIWSRESTAKRSYIWRSDDREIEDALADIAPDRETFDFNKTNQHGTTLVEGYVGSQIYKIGFGSGVGTWSNIAIAEAVSSVVSGTEQHASFIKRKRLSPQRRPSPTSIAIVSALQKVVSVGTAKNLCRPPILCTADMSTVTLPGYGSFQILAKTGTPEKRTRAGFPFDIANGFDNWIDREGAATLCDFDRNKKCELNAKGKQRYRMVCTSLLASRQSKNLDFAEHRPRSCDDYGSRLANAYRQWLTSRAQAEAKDPIASDGESTEEKRLMVILRKMKRSGDVAQAACTLFVTHNRDRSDEVFAYMRRLILSPEVLRACGFQEKL